MHDDLQAELSRLTRAEKVALAIISVTTGFANFVGLETVLATGEPNFIDRLLAGVVSVAIAAFVGTSWAHALGIGPRLTHGLYRGGALTAAAATAAVCVSMSAVWFVTAISSHETERLALAEIAAQAEASLNDASRQLFAIDSILVGAAALGADLQSLSVAEGRGEASSLGAGCGPVCRSEVNAGRAVAALSETVGARRRELGDKLEAAQASLAELQSLADQAAPFGEKRARSATLVAGLNAVLAEVSAANLPAALAQGLSPLAASFVAEDLTSEAQRALVTNVRTMVGERVAAILGGAGDEALPAPAPISAAIPNAMVRSFHFARSLIAEWGAALALDLAPLLVLAWKMLAVLDDRKSRSSRRADPYAISVGQLLEGRDFLNLLAAGAVQTDQPARAAPAAEVQASSSPPAGSEAPTSDISPAAPAPTPAIEAPALPVARRRGRPPKTRADAVTTPAVNGVDQQRESA